jgi:hypothetical protein
LILSYLIVHFLVPFPSILSCRHIRHEANGITEYDTKYKAAKELKRYEERKEYAKQVAYFKGVVSAMKEEKSE